MLGLFVYTGMAAGLGCWMPAVAKDGGETGFRLLIGYAALVIGLFGLHIGLWLPLRATAWLLAAIAAAGIVFRLARAGVRPAVTRLVIHPAAILPLIGAGAIAVNGGISYLPYTNDEFTHWLQNARIIHWAGGWHAVRDTLYLVGYTPGWLLAMLLPWQFTGRIDPGLAAAAPFILHVSVIALLYDLVERTLRCSTAPPRARAGAWLFVLLFLAAEGMGTLWPFSLLVEQPQIFATTAVALLVFWREADAARSPGLEWAAGGLLAFDYLLKTAALTFVPALVAVAIIAALRETTGRAAALRQIGAAAVRYLAPVAAVAVLWALVVQPKNCMQSFTATLSAESIAQAAALDWAGLGRRLATAIAGYIGSYKVPITILAALGFAGALMRRRYQVPVMIAIFAGGYFAALYWYHLTCFGPYYFEVLNSIPRFTRVPLQVFHAIGLLMLYDTARVVALGTDRGRRLVRRLEARPAFGALAAGALLLLGAWQVRTVHRSVVDVTTRAFQSSDPRIADMKRAAERILQLRGTVLPERPTLAILDQGRDGAIVAYARYFATGPGTTLPVERFRTLPATSWSPTPVNTWQSAGDAESVRRYLATADIIWPLRVDGWLADVLAPIVSDADCRDAWRTRAFVREKGSGATARFRCIAK